ncbi:ScbA/BarX family gamma-butyrolactone biosynthesis protein [Streptomyces sp. NPDC055749]
MDSVPSAYVHLSRSDAVLITGWKRLEKGEFSLTARWPAPPEGLPYDRRVLVQTIRQSGLAILHAEVGVPLSHQILLNSFDFTVAPGLRISASTEPCALTVKISLAEPKRPGRAASSLGMDIRILRGNAMVATAAVTFGWISPAVYRRLRGDHLSVAWNSWPLLDPVDPGTVGCTTASDVVLAPGDRRHQWQLRADVDNLLYFDHPVDHVPGLVLMEAAYQAAHAILHPAPFEATTITSAFERYTEFDRPCRIEAEVVLAAADETSVLVTGTQDGNTVFQGRLSGLAGEN